MAIVKDDSAVLCGQCHNQKNHGTYNQFLAGSMSSLKCVSCHDPHKGVDEGATNLDGAGRGIKVVCGSCHGEQASEFNGSTMQIAGIKCTDCHMPVFGGRELHVFAINTNPTAVMDFQEREWPYPENNFASGYLTVEFACLKCHEHETRDWALTHAKGIHGFVKELPR